LTDLATLQITGICHAPGRKRLMLPLVLTAAIAVAATLPSPCATPVSASLPASTVVQVDTAIQQVLAAEGAPSASVAIVLHGQIAYTKAFGFASFAPRRIATAETRYQLASASKSITAQTLLLLVDDGRLSLDAPVARWLPHVGQGVPITIRELLQHTSGLPDHYPQTYPAGPRAQTTTPDRILDEWGLHPLLSTPATQFHYSNLNYVAAGRIAELVSGKPLFALQRQRIFEPLGMTGVLDLNQVTAATPNLATGYVQVGLAPLEAAPSEGSGWSFGAGQIVATAADLARWDIGLLANRLLTASLVREETTAPVLASGNRAPYALGLFVSDKDGRRVWSHVGQGLGFLVGNTIYPDQDAAIVVLTNTSATLSFAHIADRIAYIVLPPTPADARARALVTMFRSGKLDRAGLTLEFADYLDPHRRHAYQNSLRPLGELTSLVLKSIDVADGVVTRRYDATAGGRRLSITWEELKNGQTDDFLVQPWMN
jgi:CubicO group peptidase (beta-lactamase class C family)